MIYRRLLAVAALVALAASTAGAQNVYVRPHVRQDGSYVQGHYRSAPDSSTYNNWSSQGNTNPYTGRQGTDDPYRSTSPNYDAGGYGKRNPNCTGYSLLSC